MSWSLFAREYERTCEDCGYVWRVPKGIARPHLRGLPMTFGGMTGGRGAPAGAGGGGMAGTDEVIAADETLVERAAAFESCPRCESNQYKQRPVRS